MYSEDNVSAISKLYAVKARQKELRDDVKIIQGHLEMDRLASALYRRGSDLEKDALALV